MKKAFLLLCTLLLVLGSLLPLAGYRLAKAVLGEAAASSEVPASSALPAPGGSLPGTDTGSPETAAFTGDAEVFLIEDQSTGEVQQVPRRDYLIGAVAAEMPLSRPLRPTAMFSTAATTPQPPTEPGSPPTPHGGRAT